MARAGGISVTGSLVPLAVIINGAFQEVEFGPAPKPNQALNRDICVMCLVRFDLF